VTASSVELFQDLLRACIHVISSVLREIASDLADDPDTALEQLSIGRRSKPVLRIDVGAEDLFSRYFRRYDDRRFAEIRILGEERLRDPDLDLSGETRIVALLDAIDGTDLLERGMGNWCLAVIFFLPTASSGQRILGAFVGLPTGEIYYSVADDPGVYVRVGREASRTVRGPSGVRQLADASICFYGQKIENFLSISSLEARGSDGPSGRIERPLLRSVKAISEERGGRIGFRIYNLAGIPMMLKLIDHRVREARGIDAVLDVEGQKPHDFIPAAYLAKKAGAAVKDLEGNPLSLRNLERALLRPSSSENEFRYVVAATDDLCDEIVAGLRPAGS
jgi:fructose-1,6-bisphosphatase/inositol monophosphatase family enzyme